MATAQRRKKREPFLDANGIPLASGYLQYFRAGTATALTTYSNAAGTVPNATVTIPDRPDLGALIQLDGSGNTQEPVYLQSTHAAKEVLLSASLSLTSTEDNIPAGLSDFVAPSFSAPITPWTPVSVSTTLDNTAFGLAYACTPAVSTLTITLPDATNSNGKSIKFVKLGAPGTLKLATSGGQYINGASFILATLANQTIELESDGANWIIAAEFFAPAMIGLASASGLIIANNAVTPATQIDLNATAFVLVNSAGQVLIDPAGNPLLDTAGLVTIDLTVNGVNGLDTGVMTAPNWYHIYRISNGVNFAGLASLSATAPTLPAGYSYFMRCGALPSYPALGGYYPMGLTMVRQAGDHAAYVIMATAPSNYLPAHVSNSGTWTAVQVRGGNCALPTTATRVRARLTGLYSATQKCWLAPNANYYQDNPNPSAIGLDGGGSSYGFTNINIDADLLLESDNVYYLSTNTALYVQFTGWIDNVNAS